MEAPRDPTESAPAPKAVDEATRERALKDVVVQVVARVLNLLLGVLVTALVARTLGDAGYGEWATLTAILGIIGYIAAFGMDRVAIREASAHPEQAADWVGALVMTRLALSLPAMAIGLVVLLAIRESDAMLIAGLILLLEMPMAAGSALQVVHTLRMRNGIPMAIVTINSVVWGAAVLAIYAAGGGLVALATGLTVCALLSSLMQTFASLRLLRFRLRPSRRAVARLLRVGVPVGVSGMLIVLYARIDQLLVFQVAGSEEAGYYGAVYQMLERAHLIPISVMTTLSPVIASAWPGRRERLLTVVRLASEFLLIGSLGALVFSFVAAEPVVTLLFGEEFAPAAPALPVLGGAFVMICFGYLTGNLLLVFDRTRAMVVISLLALVANVAGNLLVIPSHGFLGAAWVTLATEVVVVACSVWLIVGVLPVHRMPLGRIARIVVAAGVLWAGLALLAAAGAPLAALAAAALVGYPLLLLGLRAVELDEVRALRRGG